LLLHPAAVAFVGGMTAAEYASLAVQEALLRLLGAAGLLAEDDAATPKAGRLPDRIAWFDPRA
jgi:uncharacterized membrane protein YdfJ with MMPL/SSD domain